MKKILVVDDDEDILVSIKYGLENINNEYNIQTANNGSECLNLLNEGIPDLILLDLMMPDMDGWDVYQQMKADELTRNIPVIVVTAKAQNIDKVLGLHIAKVDDYISKPFSPQELLDSVERVLAKSR